MECAVCQTPVGADSSTCAACGAEVYPDDDGATVAGPRWLDPGTLLRLGEVLAERWELEERLGLDGPFARYRAIDQESDARVVVTVFAREMWPGAAEREAVRERLAASVGVGNRYLPGLLDVDRERALLFVVEPLVQGTSLRSVLDARRARGETMQVSEVLPVVAQLAAALAGLPPPHRHGDVRAERVVVGREGLRLISPFLLSVLSGAALVRAVAGDAAWRRALAPEVLRGTAGDAADRYGVAGIALEALAGAPPGAAFPTLRRGLEPVEEALRALLAPEPAARPGSLAGLIEALAACARLPVPDLDPGPFRRVRRAGAPRTSLLGTAAPSASPGALGEASAATAPPTARSDATLRTAALDAEGRPVAPPVALEVSETLEELEVLARVGAFPFPTDAETQPASIPALSSSGATSSSVSKSSDSPRAPLPLLPDALPSAYRLDEGQTLPERARDTRRVVALPEALAPAVLASVSRRPALGLPVRATPPISGDAASGPLAAPRRQPIAGAAAGGTQEISMDEIFETRPAQKPPEPEGLDPRLVRAALAAGPVPRAPETAEQGGPPAPRAVASARRPARRGAETQQLSAADLAEMRDDAQAAASARPAAAVAGVPHFEVRRAPDAPARSRLPALRRPSDGPIAGTLPLPTGARSPRSEAITQDGAVADHEAPRPSAAPFLLAAGAPGVPNRLPPAPTSVRPPGALPPAPRVPASERPRPRCRPRLPRPRSRRRARLPRPRARPARPSALRRRRRVPFGAVPRPLRSSLRPCPCRSRARRRPRSGRPLHRRARSPSRRAPLRPSCRARSRSRRAGARLRRRRLCLRRRGRVSAARSHGPRTSRLHRLVGRAAAASSACRSPSRCSSSPWARSSRGAVRPRRPRSASDSFRTVTSKSNDNAGSRRRRP